MNIFLIFFKTHLIDGLNIEIFDPNRNENEKYMFWVSLRQSLVLLRILHSRLYELDIVHQNLNNNRYYKLIIMNMLNILSYILFRCLTNNLIH
jgi:hypothetical protein